MFLVVCAWGGSGVGGRGGHKGAHVRELDGWAGGESEWDEYTLGFYLYCIHGCVLLPISVYTGVIQILHPWNNRRTAGAFCAREVLPEIYTEISPQRQTLLKLRCPVSGRHHSPARRTHHCPSRMLSRSAAYPLSVKADEAVAKHKAAERHMAADMHTAGETQGCM